MQSPLNVLNIVLISVLVAATLSIVTGDAGAVGGLAEPAPGLPDRQPVGVAAPYDLPVGEVLDLQGSQGDPVTTQDRTVGHLVDCHGPIMVSGGGRVANRPAPDGQHPTASTRRSVQDLVQGRQEQGDVADAGGVPHAADPPDLAGDRAEPAADLDAVLGQQASTHPRLVHPLG